MKSYPSISKEIQRDIDVYVWDKNDGSQFKAEFSRKKGFSKFGTKNCLIDEKTPTFGQAIPILMEKWSEPLTKIFMDNRWEKVTCYFEFFGATSFAGWHNDAEEKDLVLFDVAPFKQGLLLSNTFLKTFGHLHIPNLIYTGRIGKEVEQKIRNKELEGISEEGVVCKGPYFKKSTMPIMFKIKTNIWLDKLKQHCKDDLNLFEELS